MEASFFMKEMVLDLEGTVSNPLSSDAERDAYIEVVGSVAGEFNGMISSQPDPGAEPVRVLNRLVHGMLREMWSAGVRWGEENRPMVQAATRKALEERKEKQALDALNKAKPVDDEPSPFVKSIVGAMYPQSER